MLPIADGPSRIALPQLPPQDDPAPVQTGTATYYQERLADFEARNPGMEPPNYYLDYGDKYMQRFASLDGTDLSPEGLAWRDATTLALQNAIEELRISDPQGFAELERDPQAFRKFAFATHPDAYVESGLYGLSLQDQTVIAATPDIGDVLSQEGIDQTRITIGKLSPENVPDIARETGQQYLVDSGPFAFTPLGPSIAGARQAERLVDRIQDQDWYPDRFSMPEIPGQNDGLDWSGLINAAPDLVPDIDVPDDIPFVPLF